MSSSRTELLEHVRRLGQTFRRKGMEEHAKKLRLYYLALSRGLTSSATHELDIHWSAGFVREWMRTLRVPPYDAVYPLRPAGAGCERCGRKLGHKSDVITECAFPGGARKRCRSCDGVWLEADGVA